MVSDSKMVNVCGLWLNESKNGEKYFSGSLGNMNVLIFKVKEKKSEKSPDYTLCIAPREQKDKQAGITITVLR